MDVNNNKKINNPNIIGLSFQKKGEYNPALHANIEDSLELSTVKKKKKQGFLSGLVDKLKNLTVKSNLPDSSEEQKTENILGDSVSIAEPESSTIALPQKTPEDEVRELLDKSNLSYYARRDILSSSHLEHIVPLLNKYVTDENLYENKGVQENIPLILYYVQNQEQAEVANRFLSEPKFYENEYLQRNMQYILMSMPYTPNKADMVLDLFDTYLANENLSSGGETAQVVFSQMVHSIDTPEKLAVAKKILDTPLLYKDNDDENQRINYQNMNFIECLVALSNSPERISIVDRIISNQELQNIQIVKNRISDMLNWIDTEEKAKFVDKFLSSPILYKNESLSSYLSEIMNVRSYGYYSQSVDFNPKPEQIEILDKFVSNPQIYENEYLKNNIGKLVKESCTPENQQLIEKFISSPELYENEWIQNEIINILSDSQTPAQAKVADKILSNPKLFENEYIRSSLHLLVYRTKDEASAQAKINLIDKFLSEPRLYSDSEVNYEMYSFLIANNDDAEILNYKNELLDLLLTNADFSTDASGKSQLGACLGILRTPANVMMAHKLLSEKRLYDNEALKPFLWNIISRTDTDEKYEAKSIVLDKYLNDVQLSSNEDLNNEIDGIISSVDTLEKANFVIKLLDDIKSSETTPQIASILVSEYGKISYRDVNKLKRTVGNSLFNKIALSQNDLVITAQLVGLYDKNNINEISISEKRNVLRALVKNNSDLFNVSEDVRAAFPLIPKNQEEYCTLLPSLVKSLGIEVKQLDENQVKDFNVNLNTLASSIAELSDDEFNNLEIYNSYSKDEFIKDTLSIIEGLSKSEKQKVYDYFGFELHYNKNAPTKYSIVGYPVNINNGAKLAQITDENTKQVVETLRQKVIMFSENNPIQSNNPQIAKSVEEILMALPELRSTIGRYQHGAHEFDVLKHSLKVMQKIVQNPEYNNLNATDKKIMLLSALLHDITKSENKSDPTHAFECSFDAFYITKKFNLTKEEQIKLYTLINHHEWLKYVNKQGVSAEETTKRLQSVAFDLQNDNLFEMSKIFTQADIKGINSSGSLYETFGEAFDKYSKRIEEYIIELQKSKPILPTTSLPKSSEIKEKITTINPDFSTNIKGVYVKDGLLVIKYNEVEDWEALGFPEGSISKGIKTSNPIDGSEIDTGNIKFIAHGLVHANQLSNFDAFALPDSDALLSVSYMERPESKYRLFRTQGVLLDVDSKYVHGGGNTDAGSGCGKNISNFKSRYIFGGERQKDRDYISDLIKETLNLNDEEYVAFIEMNQNKSMLEIEPIEAREALIKKFALINSNVRRGNRAYNEMYISNPKVQGCFAYSAEDDVGEISEFIASQPEFLKEYAKENNLPFFVFGD